MPEAVACVTWAFPKAQSCLTEEVMCLITSLWEGNFSSELWGTLDLLCLSAAEPRGSLTLKACSCSDLRNILFLWSIHSGRWSYTLFLCSEVQFCECWPQFSGCWVAEVSAQSLTYKYTQAITQHTHAYVCFSRIDKAIHFEADSCLPGSPSVECAW